MDDKKKITRKTKAEAKRLLTNFILEIANETHESPLITGPDIDDSRMITKAEALARYIWKAGLGYTEDVEVIDAASGRVVGKKQIVHFPDKTYVTMLFDRIEGKVPNIETAEGEHKATVSDRVSKLAKDRLNSIAKQ